MSEKFIKLPVQESIDELRGKIILIMRRLGVKMTGKLFVYKSGETGNVYYDARRPLFNPEYLSEILKALLLLIPKDSTYIVLSGISGEYIAGLLANLTELPVSVVYTTERGDLPSDVPEITKHFACGQRLPNKNDNIVFIDDTYNKGTAETETNEILKRYTETKIKYTLVILDRNEKNPDVISIVRASEI